MFKKGLPSLLNYKNILRDTINELMTKKMLRVDFKNIFVLILNKISSALNFNISIKTFFKIRSLKMLLMAAERKFSQVG